MFDGLKWFTECFAGPMISIDLWKVGEGVSRLMYLLRGKGYAGTVLCRCIKSLHKFPKVSNNISCQSLLLVP